MGKVIFPVAAQIHEKPIAVFPHVWEDMLFTLPIFKFYAENAFF